MTQDQENTELWSAIEKLRGEIQEAWTLIRELRTTLVGLDGLNGMNSRVKTIETMVRGLEGKLEGFVHSVERQIQDHPLTCSIGKDLEEFIKGEEKKVDVKRLDWQKWVQTAGVLLSAVGILLLHVRWMLS